MSDNVISLADYRAKKAKKNEAGLVQAMRDSLDNKQVMQRYGIKEPTEVERLERIQKSIKRVNELMAQIHKENTK